MFRLLLGAVLVPGLVLGAAESLYEYVQVERQQQDRLRLAVRLTATSIDQFMATHAAAVALAARESPARAGEPDLEGLKALFPAFVTVLATDAQGQIRAAEPSSRAKGALMRSVADRDYFSVPARELQPYVSNAFKGRGLGTEPLVAVSAPRTVNGEFAGVVEGSIRVDAFTSLRSGALRSRGQEILVLDRSGRVIHASAGLPFTFLQPLADARFLQGEEEIDGVSPATVQGGIMPGSAWVAWSALRSGWRVVIIEPRRAALAAVWRHAAQSAAVLMLVILLVLVLAKAQMKRVARALAATLENLRALAAGEVAPDAPLNAVPPELKPIAQQIVQLAGQLQAANGEISAALAGQRELADHLQQANDRLEETVRARTSELQVANQDLERLAQTDSLTGALNLRGLHAHYGESTDRQGRLTSQVGVVIFDVDHFKLFNDRYGHPSGDQVLRRVVAAAQASLRGERDRVARVGGEEFVAFLPGADVATALRIAERIRADVHALGVVNAEGRDGRVTISLGFAVGERGDPIDSVVQLADEALYRAKSAGRNRVSP